jgi:hypothetical protein
MRLLPGRNDARLDSTTSTRHDIPNITLRDGDVIRIEGIPDGRESAAIDYIEIFIRSSVD